MGMRPVCDRQSARKSGTVSEACLNGRATNAKHAHHRGGREAQLLQAVHSALIECLKIPVDFGGWHDARCKLNRAQQRGTNSRKSHADRNEGVGSNRGLAATYTELRRFYTPRRILRDEPRHQSSTRG